MTATTTTPIRRCPNYDPGWEKGPSVAIKNMRASKCKNFKNCNENASCPSNTLCCKTMCGLKCTGNKFGKINFFEIIFIEIFNDSANFSMKAI